ncbi:MAG: hypothetical protein ACRENG_17550, partial [bacterium]
MQKSISIATQPNPSKLWRWVRRILMILGILVFLFLFVVVPLFFSHVITHAGSRPMDRDIKMSTVPD